MEIRPRLLILLILPGLLTFYSLSSTAQAIDPQRSAKAEVMSDALFIESNISDNEDVMFLSKKAMERAGDPKVKELAQQMLADRSGMLYSIGQLQVAGTGSSKKSAASVDDQRPAAIINNKLSNVSGANFDTVWVTNMLIMHQAKYDELLQAKETVTNPQLKMAITEAIPLIRRHVTQLKSLQKYLIKMAAQKKKEALQKTR